MELAEKINSLKERAAQLRENLKTEEATKNALILPFLSALGYDVFNPLEVVPEYVPDKGFKKDERVDYAVFKDTKPAILIECKRIENEKLDIKKHGAQLFKYFTASKAKFIIFTNGVVYKFFSDIEEKNILDKEPFFTFNLLDYKQSQIDTLVDFCKENFDIDKAFTSAGDLKYIRSFEDVIENEYRKPSDEFVKYLLDKSGIYEGIKTSKIIEKHKKTAVEALNLFMSKIMRTSIELSLNSSSEAAADKNKIVTTQEEIEGYAIIKAILNGIVDISRVTYRDNSSYFNILLDNNILKTICRLYLNRVNKYIAFLTPQKGEGKSKEEKFQINGVNDIFVYKERIVARVKEIEQTYAKN